MIAYGEVGEARLRGTADSGARRSLAAGIVLLTALVLAGGCGSALRPRSHPATADGCLELTGAARRLELRPTSGPSPVPAVLVGTGRTAFVLTDESDENLCSWLPFVTILRERGYAALLYDYLDPASLPAEVAAAARAAIDAGAMHVVLLGASVGARASIEAAAAHPAGVSAVVSLSAEQTVRSDSTDLARVARRLTLPTLLVSAREDPFVEGFTPTLLRAIATRDKRALILSGIDHGTALLTDSDGPRVRATILGFISRANPPVG